MRRKLPNIIVITILTAITSIIWIAYSVYDAYIKGPEVKIEAEILENINPILDSEVLANLSEKVYFERGQTEAFPIEIQSEIDVETNSTEELQISESELPDNEEVENNSATESSQLSP